MSGVSSAVMIGAAGKSPRKKSDFYSTPPECTEALMRAAGDLLPGRVWEPACGTGAIAQVVKRYDREVVCTDLEDYGYGQGGVDFLTTNEAQGDCIITNPPFSLAAEFILKARSFNQPVAMLLKSIYWHASKRQKLFEQTGPSHILAMTWRPNFDPILGTSSTMDFIWTIWGPEPAAICQYRPIGRPV